MTLFLLLFWSDFIRVLLIHCRQFKEIRACPEPFWLLITVGDFSTVSSLLNIGQIWMLKFKKMTSERQSQIRCDVGQVFHATSQKFLVFSSLTSVDSLSFCLICPNFLTLSFIQDNKIFSFCKSLIELLSCSAQIIKLSDCPYRHTGTL